MIQNILEDIVDYYGDDDDDDIISSSGIFFFFFFSFLFLIKQRFTEQTMSVLKKKSQYCYSQQQHTPQFMVL